MVRYIVQLLTEQDCVIIPEVGGLVGNYQPARVDMHSGKLFPPGKQIAFNRSLTHNDGLLANRVAQAENLNYAEALLKVRDFARQCNQSLEQSGSCVLEGVGRLYYDDEKRIQFSPMPGDNFLSDAWGLPVLDLKPVQRYREAAQKATSAPLEPNIPVANSRWLYAIMGSVALLALVASFVVNLKQVNNITEFSSIIPVRDIKAIFEVKPRILPAVVPVDKETTATLPADTEWIYVEEGVSDTQSPWSAVIDKADEVVAPVMLNPEDPAEASYHTIIVGAFEKPVNAERFYEELSARGYRVSMLQRGKYNMVGVQMERARYPLPVAIDSIKRSVHDSAWALR